ncbi:MAG: hypothetical protein AUF67_13075 [Acidobacteria bacterium 13_1_20CM_58_21]|nr:MAG: hypothetical protein AUF67_13075 [Acidobacteria bacterium 13_1_20CM_58_21]
MEMFYLSGEPRTLGLGRVTLGGSASTGIARRSAHQNAPGIPASANDSARNTLKGLAETVRMPDISSKSQFIRAADGWQQGLWPSRSPKAGKFSRAVELFYLEFVRQFIEKKDVRIGLELAIRKSVGEANRGSL